MPRPIYLDYMSTTPVDPLVSEAMVKCLGMENNFGNPASTTHIYGWEAKELVEESRQHVANIINANEREIVWMSGATEANNLAVKGAALFYKRKGRHLITSSIEHKSVLEDTRSPRTPFDQALYPCPPRPSEMRHSMTERDRQQPTQGGP